ncbi:MAG: Ig domain-containing protein [bacterium]
MDYFKLRKNMPVINTNNFKDAKNFTVNQAFSVAVSVNGGTPGYTWDIIDFPEWLKWETEKDSGNSNSLLKISGTPPTVGTYNLIINVTDSSEQIDTRPLSFDVIAQSNESENPNQAEQKPEGENNNSLSQPGNINDAENTEDNNEKGCFINIL